MVNDEWLMVNGEVSIANNMNDEQLYKDKNNDENIVQI